MIIHRWWKPLGLNLKKWIPYLRKHSRYSLDVICSISSAFFTLDLVPAREHETVIRCTIFGNGVITRNKIIHYTLIKRAKERWKARHLLHCRDRWFGVHRGYVRCMVVVEIASFHCCLEKKAAGTWMKRKGQIAAVALLLSTSAK